MTETTGEVLSIVTVWLAAVPVFPAASVWIAERVLVASAVSTVDSVRVQVPAEHGVEIGAVAAPLIRGLTVAMSPAKVPQVPPIVVTFVFVTNGNVRADPFTLATATIGAVVSLTIVTLPLAPLEAVQLAFTPVTT